MENKANKLHGSARVCQPNDAVCGAKTSVSDPGNAGCPANDAVANANNAVSDANDTGGVPNTSVAVAKDAVSVRDHPVSVCETSVNGCNLFCLICNIAIKTRFKQIETDADG